MNHIIFVAMLIYHRRLSIYPGQGISVYIYLMQPAGK